MLLLDAWKQLAPQLRQTHDLLIAGPEGWGAEKTLARIRAEAIYTGYVPESDLPGLVAGAAAFVCIRPSMGASEFPVVQAMAAGVAVVASNASCLPEVTGGAAVLVDPRSPAEIAAALTLPCSNPESFRASLAVQGRQRAQLFQWENCAAESLDFFRRIAGD